MLTFEKVAAAVVARDKQVFHSIESWSPLELAGAMGGESGETANLTKKLRRGEPVPPELIAKEAADTVIYAFLLCDKLGVSLETALVAKFNEVSERRGSDLRL